MEQTSNPFYHCFLFLLLALTMSSCAKLGDGSENRVTGKVQAGVIGTQSSLGAKAIALNSGSDKIRVYLVQSTGAQGEQICETTIGGDGTYECPLTDEKIGAVIVEFTNANGNSFCSFISDLPEGKSVVGINVYSHLSCTRAKQLIASKVDPLTAIGEADRETKALIGISTSSPIYELGSNLDDKISDFEANVANPVSAIEGVATDFASDGQMGNGESQVIANSFWATTASLSTLVDFEMSGPGNGVNGENLILTWEEALADSYQIYVCSDQGLQDCVVNQTVTGLELDLRTLNLSGGTYYIRITAQRSDGSTKDAANAGANPPQQLFISSSDD